MRPLSFSTILLVGLTLAGLPDPSAAQTDPEAAGDTGAAPESGVLVGVGTGLGWGTMAVDSDIGKRSGAVLVAHVGLTRSGLRAWALELEAQGFQVPNPVADEGFRAYRVLARSSFGRPFYVAPGLGLEHRRWRGADRRRDAETALALAASVGRHVPVGRGVVLLPEVSWSYSPLGRAESGSGAGLSLRVSAVWSTSSSTSSSSR